MKITCPVFTDQQPVPVKYTCKGENISPPLEFRDIPADAKSLVLIVEDLDSTNNWIHWLVYNISPNLKGIEEGQLPGGAVDGICNGGTHGYEGPCPKYFAGIHQYSFKLYALNVALNVPHNADVNMILEEMEGHILDTAVLIGLAQGEQVKIHEHHS